MMERFWWALVLLAAVVAAAAADTSPLEQLDAATALSNVRARSGVVFVDLYADW